MLLSALHYIFLSALQRFPQSHNKLMGPLWMNMQCLEKTTHSLRTHETGTSSHESQAEATGTLRRCHRLAAGMNEICLFHNDSQAWLCFHYFDLEIHFTSRIHFLKYSKRTGTTCIYYKWDSIYKFQTKFINEYWYLFAQ